MWKKFVHYITSIVFLAAALLGIILLVALVYGAITGMLSGEGLFRAPAFYRTATDALFLVGGAVFTFGALVEFFLKAYSRPLARRITFPRSLAGTEAPRSGGWMLIFSGALLILASLAFAIIAMK